MLEGDLAGGYYAGGYYIEPTIFKSNNKMRVFQEEIFGPVVSVTTFHDSEECSQNVGANLAVELPLEGSR